MNEKVRFLLEQISELSNMIAKDKINIMEVCGTHTHVIYETGIREMIPKKINLISGPGCPVCVTHSSFIDNAIAIGKDGTTIITFGDIAKVKGSTTSLLEERKNGVDLKIVYSIGDIIDICKKNKDKNFAFLGVGFETTAPLIGTMIKRTYEEEIKNLWFYNSIKIMPPILKKIFNNSYSIDGFILPGHVAVIEGEQEFSELCCNHKIPGVIAGFTFEHVLTSIYFILKEMYNMQTGKKFSPFYNVYKPYVAPQGNVKAKQILREIFTIEHGLWRGIGLIENSSLIMQDCYKTLNAEEKFSIKNKLNTDEKGPLGCKCSEVIMGKVTPYECKLFKNICNTKNPIGPCMVSMEGACYCAYKFEI